MKHIFRPSFLLQLDRWLRANHPVVWRTRVHWMLYYSVALAMPLLYALSWLVPVRITYLPDFDSLHTIGGLIDMMAWMALGYWLYTQVRIKLVDRSIKALGLTALLSGMICVVIWTTSLVFNVSVFSRIEKLRSAEEVEEDLGIVSPFKHEWYTMFDYEVYQNQQKGMYDFVPLQPVALSQARARQIAHVASTYGMVDPQIEIFTEDGDVFGLKEDTALTLWKGGDAIAINIWVGEGANPYQGRHNYYYQHKGEGVNLSLQYALEKMEMIHFFWQGTGELNLRYMRPMDRRFKYFGMLWLLVTILGLSKRTLGPEAWNLKRWLPTGSLPALPRWEWLQRLEGRLVVRQPDRWGMRVYAIWGGILGLIGGSWALSWGLTRREGVDLLEMQPWWLRDWAFLIPTLAILGVVLGVLRTYFLRAKPFGINPGKQLGYLVSMGIAITMLSIGIAGFFVIDQLNLAAVRSDKEFAEDAALFADHVYLDYEHERHSGNENAYAGLTLAQHQYVWPKDGTLDLTAWKTLAKAYGFDEVKVTEVAWRDMPASREIMQDSRKVDHYTYLEYESYPKPDSIDEKKVWIRQYDVEGGRWRKEAYPISASLISSQLYQLHFTYRSHGQSEEVDLIGLRGIVKDIHRGKKLRRNFLEDVSRLDIDIIELLGAFGGIWALIIQFLVICWAVKFTSIRETFLAVLGIFVLGFLTVLLGVAIQSGEFFAYFLGPVWLLTVIGITVHYAHEELLQTAFNRITFLIVFLLTPLTSMMVLGYLGVGLVESEVIYHMNEENYTKEVLIFFCVLAALAFYLIVTRVQLKGLQRMWYAPKMK